MNTDKLQTSYSCSNTEAMDREEGGRGWEVIPAETHRDVGELHADDKLERLGVEEADGGAGHHDDARAAAAGAAIMLDDLAGVLDSLALTGWYDSSGIIHIAHEF